MTAIPYPQALILAAGMGTRLNPVSGNRYPKPFQPVGGVPLIERSIRQLRRAGVEDIVIVTGHHADAFSTLANDSDVRLLFNPQYAALGSATSFLCAADAVREPFFLLEADLLYDIRALSMADGSPDPNHILTSAPLALDDNVYVKSRDGVLTSVSKEIPESGGDVVMTGIWALSAGFLPRVRAWADRTGADVSGHYETLLADYSAAAEPIRLLHDADLVWCEVDNEDHLLYAEQNVLPRLSP
jgi:choline kinase